METAEKKSFFHLMMLSVRFGRDSSVGTTTRYGLDGPGIESSWWGFSPSVQTCPETHPASCTSGTGSLPGLKRPGRGVDHPRHLASRLKKLYSFTSTTPMGPLDSLQGELCPL